MTVLEPGIDHDQGVGRLWASEALHPGLGHAAIAALLESLRAVSGASRAIWLLGADPVASSKRRGRDVASHSRVARDLTWLSHATSERIDRAALDRMPPTRALGFSGALLSRGGGAKRSSPTLVLLFEEPTPWNEVDERAVPAAPATSASASPQAVRQEIEILAEVGRNSATLAHDLRHLLTLAGMQLDRARVSRSEGAINHDLNDLEATLQEARAYCEAGMPSHGRERRRTSHNLRDLLQATAGEAVRIVGPGRSVEVHVRCPMSLRIEDQVDPLTRLVRNLVLNAIEASTDGVQVRIDATQPDENHIDLCIGDCGRGMEASELELFYSRACSGGSGTGIGTLSVLDAVRHLGATIEVESEPSRGTRVHVVLPTRPSAETALVVDGNDARRRNTAATYEARGCPTKQAANARAALALLESHPIDRLIAARGTIGPGWEALRHRALQLGVRLSVRSVLGD